MKRLLLAAGAALCLSGAAHASITPVLDSVTADGSDFIFTYHATLSGDEGLTTGSQLVIFDFLGYLDGSLTSPSANFVASSAASGNFNVATGGVQVNPMFGDDLGIPDLILTYTGPDLNTSGGPFADVALGTFTAKSSFGGVALDGFSARAISNDGVGTVGTDSFNNGAVGVAEILGVPEPSSWALMILGFGGIGGLIRSKRRGIAHPFA